MGGVGKSTVAARLLERMAGYDRIFGYRQLDEAKLLRSLSEQCTSETGLKILQGELPLMQRLTKFLQQGLNQPEQRFVFVLDDFEANLELRADGVQVLKTGAIEVLMALLKAFANSRLPHKMLITCRYDFRLPELDRRLEREPLAALQGADLRKKCDRLTSFNAQSEVDPGLQERAKKTADGNPRLLEWLDKVLQDKQLDRERILHEMEKAEQKFRENILAEELLKQQQVELRQMLGLALVYEIPVPRTAIAAVCADISNLEDRIHRATALGLLEISHLQAECYRVPRILEKPLEAFVSQAESHHRNASEVLHRLWCVEAKTPTEAQLMEIHRLAILGKEEKITAEVTVTLSSQWRQNSRFREVVKTCRDTLEIVEDYLVLHELAISENYLGDNDKALEHYEQAFNLCPPEDEGQKAATLHQLASIYANRGEIEQVIALYEQSLELTERIGNVQGKAATLHQLASIYANRGEIEQAIALYEQSLELEERIGNVQGKAMTLWWLGWLAKERGEFATALDYLQPSFEILQRIKSPDAEKVRKLIADVQHLADNK